MRNHLSSAMGKLGAANRAEAVRIATQNGWLGLNPGQEGTSGSSNW